MAINLDDYLITIECLNQFEDNDINKWINSSKKPKKVERKLKKMSEYGGKCTINNFDIVSTDTVNVPFLIRNSDQWNIQLGKARLVQFYPSLNEDLDGNMNISKADMSMKVAEINKKNEKIAQNIKVEEFVTEITPKKNRKSKQTEAVNESSVTMNSSIEIGEITEKKKSKKRRHAESLQTEIKTEKCAQELPNVLSPPKTKKHKPDTENTDEKDSTPKKRKSNITTTETNDVEVKKKKKKSKVTFADEDTSILFDKNEMIAKTPVDLNLSSRLAASEDTDTVTDENIHHKKSKKKNQIK